MRLKIEAIRITRSTVAGGTHKACAVYLVPQEISERDAETLVSMDKAVICDPPTPESIKEPVETEKPAAEPIKKESAANRKYGRRNKN